jgi:uncharacterized integral membrane protein
MNAARHHLSRSSKGETMFLRETTPTVPAPGADTNGASTPAETIPQSANPPVAETRGARFSRKARRTRFHAYAALTVALLVCLIALVVANTRQVKLDWVVGSSTASLVWIVLFSAVLGWLLGLVSGALFRWRTRAPRS